MTIYTKQTQAEDDDKKLVPSLEVKVQVESERTSKPPKKTTARESTSTRLTSTDINELLRQQRRRRLCLQCFLLFGILLGLSICLFGTLYLYRNNYNKTYSGWCGVRYVSKPEDLSADGNGSATQQPTTAAFSYLDEDVYIEDDIETIDVPKFEDSDRAIFVLDFRQEITLIQDITDQVCYILPLDTEKIPPPATFRELLYRYSRGDFTPDAEEIQENYRVIHPALDIEDVEYLYGEIIASRCADYETYELIRIGDDDATTTTTTTTTTTENVMSQFFKNFGMFPGGDYLIKFRITL